MGAVGVRTSPASSQARKDTLRNGCVTGSVGVHAVSGLSQSTVAIKALPQAAGNRVRQSSVDVRIAIEEFAAAHARVDGAAACVLKCAAVARSGGV